MKKLIESKSASDLGYFFECPGCEQWHRVRTQGSEPCWTFNNDLEKPTFNPSLLVRWDYKDGRPTAVCHSFIRDGQIQFLSDCTHPLAGKTVPLKDVKDGD